MGRRSLPVLLGLVCLLTILPAWELITNTDPTGGGGGGPWKQVLLSTSTATGALTLCFTYTTLLTQSITTSGGTVLILASDKDVDGNGNSVEITVLRGATVLGTYQHWTPNPNVGTLMLIDTPAAGTYTYTLEACAIANATGSSYGPSSLMLAEHS